MAGAGLPHHGNHSMRGKDYSTGLRGGLFEMHHYARMGTAIWLYGWLVLRQTNQQEGMGWVLGGKPITYREIEEETGFNRRTLERWRQWWLSIFVESSFWREARARFMPPLCPKTMPLSLCVSFGIERRDRLLELLKFLAPITTPTAWKEFVM